jgi:hypothetical protein
MSIKHIKRVGDQNAHVVTHADGTKVLYSYNTPVAESSDAGLKHTNKKWSVTTSRQINKFLREDGRRPVPADQSYFDQAHGTLSDAKFNHKNKKETPLEKPYDHVGAIMSYEQGDLDEEGTTKLFQHLVDTGLAWQLQGSYGRTAKAMLDAGIIHPKSEMDKGIKSLSAKEGAAKSKAEGQTYKVKPEGMYGSDPGYVEPVGIHNVFKKDAPNTIDDHFKHIKPKDTKGTQYDKGGPAINEAWQHKYSTGYVTKSNSGSTFLAHHQSGDFTSHNSEYEAKHAIVAHHYAGYGDGKRTEKQIEASKKNLVHAREAYRNKMHSTFHQAAGTLAYKDRQDLGDEYKKKGGK